MMTGLFVTCSSIDLVSASTAAMQWHRVVRRPSSVNFCCACDTSRNVILFVRVALSLSKPKYVAYKAYLGPNFADSALPWNYLYLKQKAQLSLRWADRTVYIRRSASDFRSRKESDLPEWVQPHVRCGNTVISKVTLIARIRYGNSARVGNCHRLTTGGNFAVKIAAKPLKISLIDSHLLLLVIALAKGTIAHFLRCAI